jgi:non-specific serine/threonine protein kinase
LKPYRVPLVSKEEGRMAEPPEFGAQLRRYRERSGLSQEALADLTQLAATGVAALERGRRRRPYPDTVRRLADALALSPEERATFGAAARPTGDSIAEALRQTPMTNIKLPRTRLIGREQAVAALTELVAEQPGRLVTLTGIGGSGKTRLALAVAAAVGGRFPGGTWLIELAPLTDPALVPEAVAAALELPEMPDVPLLGQIEAALGHRSVLLLLDNCEHLLDACAAFVERLLSACAGLRILATSREPLQIAGERQWRVLPLALPEPDVGSAPATVGAGAAVQLFVDRAQAVDAAFHLTMENARAVAEICTRLGGLPLAIELAAAWVRVLTVAQIRDRLDDSLRMLRGNARALPTRHQTMRATLEWSYGLLTAAEQWLLRRLSVFVDGCELEAVEAVAVGDDLPADRMLHLVSGLVDKSLLLVEDEADGRRYRLLEPVRQFAVGLAPAAEREAVQARQATWYTALAEQATLQLRGPEQLTWIARLRRELGNLREVLAWANAHDEAEMQARLAVALSLFIEGLTYLSDSRQALARVLARPPGAVSPALRRQALLAAGRQAPGRGDPEGAVALLNACLADARAAGDQAVTAEALAYLGLAHFKRGAAAAALASLQESLALAREHDDNLAIALALFLLGSAAIVGADYPRARRLLQESLERYQRAGHLRYIAAARTQLGIATAMLGERREAATLLREGMAGHLAVGDRLFISFRLRQLAAVLADMLPQEAIRLVGAAEALRERLGGTLAPLDRAIVERTLATAGAYLSPIEAARHLEEGRALTLEEAVAAAVNAAERLAEATEVSLVPSLAGALESLTAREHDVARLVAEGYTDRQMAESLGISVRTVGSHVQHLLAKLGLHSRWQVADWAQAQIGGTPPS